MDCKKVGALIAQLRKGKNITQKQLADRLNISDRAVSKWERGLGLPDVSILSEVAEMLGITVETLLCGEVSENDLNGGNMKETKYYVCKSCGNIALSTGNAEISCCGKKMTAETPQKANDENTVEIHEVENELYITSRHPMTKEHYISFAAFADGGSLYMAKQYPEWDFQLRLPRRKHGMLIWYCTRHGLFYKYM